ncbi:RNA degradosome polyphosphate kinase [Mesobacillus foraminis]|uniref:RNA degradosome polyphosphate kinase n=1 Tax=Mesobacillus foraminis TaxID=279826 RepID=UPI001BEADDD2|nr:RNA degradosome polyphosphate kinase [Mesobacillus foraminis]MBT2758028.1 RNA degradosome polyphosphate kinase [Mesobacillus foraminis]
MTTAELQKKFSQPAYYNNRELSWLAFNQRVLEEAVDEGNPLLERLKFLAIFSSNLDEFMSVRVAGIKYQVLAGYNKPENKAGLTPKEQLLRISEKGHELVQKQYDIFNKKILPELKKEKVLLLQSEELTDEQQQYLKGYFEEMILPVLTPMAVDAYRAFPMLLNKSLNLAIVLEDEEETPEARSKLALVQVPAVLSRYVLLPANEGEKHFILLEDVISFYIHKLFKGYRVCSVSQFRITRNADLTIHEEGARDLLTEIEEELKKRKWGSAVRLEVKKQGKDQDILDFLLKELEIHVKDVYEIEGPLDLTFLFGFYGAISKDKEHLTYEKLIPQTPNDLKSYENIFEIAAEQDILLHHPYESFKPVIEFISDAADDPDVLAIKQTLYRVSGDSPIIEALKRAGEKGKQVTVLVELKARFDEENNVQWAKELEKAGCHVIYGINHLKTHSKITLVVRKGKNSIDRFVHLGTGNYNDATAKTYTDLGLITSNQKIGIDATNFFNYLSGYMEKPRYHHLSVAPFAIRDDLIRLIDQEIYFHKQSGNGRIIAKMNSITDKPIIMKLYEASCAGVKIDLIVRGICCLKPGIHGISENIRVLSIVGRFLEHTRIYSFHHNGEEKIFLSSADLMTRNMENRVEIQFPILNGKLKKRIQSIFSLMLSDNVKARVQDSQGNYHYVKRGPEEEEIDSQLILYKMAYCQTE